MELLLHLPIFFLINEQQWCKFTIIHVDLFAKLQNRNHFRRVLLTGTVINMISIYMVSVSMGRRPKIVSGVTAQRSARGYRERIHSPGNAPFNHPSYHKTFFVAVCSIGAPVEWHSTNSLFPNTVCQESVGSTTPSTGQCMQQRERERER